jgi:hypothetical protein
MTAIVLGSGPRHSTPSHSTRLIADGGGMRQNSRTRVARRGSILISIGDHLVTRSAVERVPPTESC